MTQDIAAEPTFCPRDKRIFLLIATVLASSMAFIDGSVVSIATTAMRADLGASLSDVQWVSSGYLLLLSSLLLIGGAVGDRFGLRNVFGIGIALFVLPSIAAALAPNPPLLIAARIVQGFGAAFMVPASLAIIAKAYPREERGAAIGIWAAASSFTTIAGPIIGGLVLTAFGNWSWRLVFAVNLPLGIAALVLLFTQVPEDKPDAGRRLDIVGGLLVTVALLLLALGLTGEDTPASGKLLLCGGGVVVMIAFLLWEARTKTPMLPLGLFRQRAFSGAQGLTFALYFGLAAIGFYLPMTLIAGWGVSPAVVALVQLPLGVALTVLSPFSGKLADKVGPGPMIAAGSVIVALGFLGLGVLAPTHSVWGMVLPMMILFGVGMGLVVSPLSTAVMTSVADHDTGTASGVNNAVARVAGLLAVATMGGVAAYVFERSLGGAAELPLFFGQAPSAPLPSDTEAVRVAATDAAFAAIAYITAALSLLSGIIAWFTLERKIGQRAA